MVNHTNTKNQILELLSRKMIRNSDIARRLNMADATIMQHLNELMDSGKIHRYGRYYTVNRF